MSPAPRGLGTRVLGIVTSPGETFRSVVAHPRWLGVLALTTVVTALCAALPLTTDAGKQANIDQQVRVVESMTGRPMNDQEYDALQRRSRFAPHLTAGSVLVFGPLVACVIAGLLWVVFNALMGGNATFKQVLAVVAHASVISTMGAMFVAPINYVQGTVLTSAANLQALVPVFDESSFAGWLMRSVDLFLIWWVLVLAIGLAVLYQRRTQPIAAALLAVYGVLALAVAAVMSAFGGGA